MLKEVIGYGDIVAAVTIMLILIMCMFWPASSKGYLRDIIWFSLFCILAGVLALWILTGIEP